MHSLRPGFPTSQLDERLKDNELPDYCHKFEIFAVAGPLPPIFVLSRAGELMRTSRKAFNPGTLRLVN